MHKALNRLSKLVLASEPPERYRSLPDVLLKEKEGNVVKNTEEMKHLFEYDFYSGGWASTSLRSSLLEVYLEKLNFQVDYSQVMQYLLDNENEITRESGRGMLHGYETANQAYKILKSGRSAQQIFNAQMITLINDAIEGNGVSFTVGDDTSSKLYIPLIEVPADTLLNKALLLKNVCNVNLYSDFLEEVDGTIIESDDRSFISYKISFRSIPSVFDIKTKKEFPINLCVYCSLIIQILGDSNAEVEFTGPKENKLSERQDLTADQISLLRQFDLQEVSEIRSDKLRRLPFALNNPVLKKILDENPVLTPEAVLKYKPEDLLGVNEQTRIYSDIRSGMQTGFRKFNKNVQVIFSEQNYSFVVGINRNKITDIFKDSQIGVLESYMMHTNHPSLDKNILTIGWVRFTRLSNNNIWIDEVQTDLTKKLGEADLKRVGGMNGLTKFILETFISTMRGKGFEQFFMPDLATKKNIYRADPPESIYTELPKKLRFKQVPLPETGLLETENQGVSTKLGAIGDRPVWVLASTEVSDA